MINISNFQLRFTKVAERLPEHEDLTATFKYYTKFKITNNIKYLYAACGLLERLEGFSLETNEVG